MIQEQEGQQEVFEVTKEYRDLILMGASVRGFKSGARFMSPNGVKGLVKGSIIIKDNGDNSFKGDLVSTAGFGCIYDRVSNRWAEII